MPTPIELQSLLDYTIGTGPAIDSIAFPNTVADSFWTALPVASAISGGGMVIWRVSFTNYAAVNYNGVNSDTINPFRCVRGSSANPSVRYTDGNDNALTASSAQVKDQSTGLIWQRVESLSKYPWSSSGISGSAQNYCQNLALGGYAWRLPTIKEFTALVDISRSSPSINSAAFPGALLEYLWSSTGQVNAAGSAWGVNFYDGTVAGGGIDTPRYVRCVTNSEVSTVTTPTPVFTTPLPTMLVDREWALWHHSTGVYADSTNQAARYTEVVSGVVTDTLTSLQWEKVASSATYTWSSAGVSGSAQAYCASRTTGGFNDWRLPTRVELRTLADFSVSSPAINSVAFPGTPSSYFWTSTSGDPFEIGRAWYGEFINGGVSLTPSTTTKYCRCVRQGTYVALPSSGRYTDEAGGTLTAASTQVKDAFTGLIWQRMVSGTYSMSSALAYCASLTLGGYPWRLPTVKELDTLVDVKASGCAIDAGAFPNIPHDYFYVSTPYLSYSAAAWVSVPCSGGGIGTVDKSYAYYARCVR